MFNSVIAMDKGKHWPANKLAKRGILVGTICGSVEGLQPLSPAPREYDSSISWPESLAPLRVQHSLLLFARSVNKTGESRNNSMRMENEVGQTRVIGTAGHRRSITSAASTRTIWRASGRPSISSPSACFWKVEAGSSRRDKHRSQLTRVQDCY